MKKYLNISLLSFNICPFSDNSNILFLSAAIVNLSYNNESFCLCNSLTLHLEFIVSFKFVPQLKTLSVVKAGTIIIYFVVTLIFSYCISRRFNRKLFRFSVTKTMKGDGKHD